MYALKVKDSYAEASAYRWSFAVLLKTNVTLMENELVTSFLSIGIVGAALSYATQWLQDKYGVEGTQTKAIAIGGSVVLGAAVWFLQGTELWASIIGVLAAASTVYAMYFKGKVNSREDV